MVSDIDSIDGAESIISNKTKIHHKKKRQGTKYGAYYLQIESAVNIYLNLVLGEV